MPYTEATSFMHKLLGDEAIEKIEKSNKTLATFAAMLEDITDDRNLNKHSPHHQKVVLDVEDLPVEGKERFYRITVQEITEDEYEANPEA